MSIKNFAGIFFLVFFSDELNDDIFVCFSRGVLMSTPQPQFTDRFRFKHESEEQFILIRNRALIMGSFILTEVCFELIPNWMYSTTRSHPVWSFSATEDFLTNRSHRGCCFLKKFNFDLQTNPLVDDLIFFDCSFKTWLDYLFVLI